MTDELTLVAHRGSPAEYPENTIPSIEASLAAGAKAIEFDVQLSADGIPYLFHDPSLDRLTGQSGLIMQTHSNELAKLSAHAPEQFDGKFAGTTICTLAETVDFLQDETDIIVMAEIKEESLAHFGIEKTMDCIFDILTPIRQQAYITSFSYDALRYSHASGIAQTAWVLREYSDTSRQLADKLAAQFLLCNLNKIPEHDKAFWPGPWEWMLYSANTPELAQQYYQRGVRYIETDCIGHMLAAMSD